MKVRVAVPIGLFASTVGAMAYSYFTDSHYPYSAATSGVERYGHNRGGLLGGAVLVVIIELAIYFLLVQPWRERPPVLGSVAALVVAAPWVFASLVVTMHAGGVIVVHFLWAAALSLLISLGLVRRISQRRSRG